MEYWHTLLSASSDFSDLCSWTKPTGFVFSPGSLNFSNPLTSENDGNSYDNADSVVILPHQRTDQAASKQQEDERVLVNLLCEFEDEGFGRWELEFVGTITC